MVKNNKTETVYTYSEWKRIMKKRKRRKFVRRWNGNIDRVKLFIGNIKRENILTGVLAVTCTTMFIGLLGYAGKSDLETKCIRTEYGTYQSDGYIITSDGERWEIVLDNPDDFMKGELVTVVFNTNGTEEIYDDAIDAVEGWKVCK